MSKLFAPKVVVQAFNKKNGKIDVSTNLKAY